MYIVEYLIRNLSCVSLSSPFLMCADYPIFDLWSFLYDFIRVCIEVCVPMCFCSIACDSVFYYMSTEIYPKQSCQIKMVCQNLETI